MQRFSLVVLVALVAYVSAHSNDVVASNNLVLGYRVAGDQLIEQRVVKKHGIPFLTVKEDVAIAGDGKFRITKIEAIDLENNPDKSAKVNLVSGGVGQTFVLLHFKSTRGNGINHLVKVYGKRDY